MKQFFRELSDEISPNQRTNTSSLPIGTQTVYENSGPIERANSQLLAAPLLLSTPDPPHASVAFAVPFPRPIKIEDISQPEVVVSDNQSVKDGGWAGLKMFANALNEGVGVFGPLKQAVDALVSSISTFEVSSVFCMLLSALEFY